MRAVERLYVLIAEGNLEAPFALLTPADAGAVCRAALVALAFLAAAVKASRASPGALPWLVVTALLLPWAGLVHLLVGIGVSKSVRRSRDSGR